ncbi:MAG: tRNA-dihydrouridine synthase family protein [Desulfobulbaceae bacterium]|nr:tRNA-dihydrouridine synthase family protein [Desulfobulbaceae bacterium]
MHITDGLPWKIDTIPLMLAPMQGLTNRALRDLFIRWVRPDVVFTEYVRVHAKSKLIISKSDRREITGAVEGVPLVVQLIGSDTPSLVEGAELVQDLGVNHLNINLGCPYGRMNSGTAGGALLANPSGLGVMLAELRRTIRGSFSVKVRAGFDDPSQIFSLLGIFEQSGVDFIILHPRTVAERYSGHADHDITARLVEATTLPVIANGDIFTAETGRKVMAHTRAAGLMLGRGAIGDPLLFARLRGEYPDRSTQEQRLAELRYYLENLMASYQALFCGDQQLLPKLKEVIAQIRDPEFDPYAKKLKKCRNSESFCQLVSELPFLDSTILEK